MFDRFTESASDVMCLAYAESERLRHDYVGPEHVLVGLAQQHDSRVAGILTRSGLGPNAIRTGLDRLVAQGILPGPWRNQADLLGSLGIDLEAVRRAAEDSFGAEALSVASRRSRSRSRLRAVPIVSVGPQNPLCGKAFLAKRAVDLARRSAHESSQTKISTEHLLLGVLRDAEDPPGTGLSRGAKRMGSYLGLPHGGRSPVRLVIEGAGLGLDSLRARVLADPPHLG